MKRKQTYKKSILAVSLLTALNLPNTAALASTDVEKITVTSSRSAVNIDDALASLVVITRSDIEQVQANSIADVLATVAGIDLASQGGKGQQSSVYMRGANSNHTLVLIDGVRISSATLGSTEINNISPELVERIEIVKGPRAALWGSDAIGGVIQIFTRKLEGGEKFAGVMFGSDNFRQARAGFGIKHGDGQTTVSLNHEQSDGFDVLNTYEPDEDSYQQTSFAINGNQKINKQLDVSWLASFVDGENDYDPKYGFGANQAEINNHVWQVKANYQTGAKNLTTFSIGQNRDSGVNFGGGTAKADANLIETRRDQLSIVNNYQHDNNLQVNFGVDFAVEDISSDTDYALAERDILGVFAHGFLQLSDFDFELAVRHDDVESFDQETTYNFGTGYQLDNGHRFILNIGTGFKAPTFNDLYWPDGGNENLLSETSSTIEAVYKGSVSGVQFNAAVYQSDIDDLIAWAPTDAGPWQPQNVNNVEVTGAELTTAFVTNELSHQINASYTDAENKETGKQLDRRAKQQFSYVVSADIDDVALNFEYQYNGKRKDSQGYAELNSYSLLNIRASYPITSALTVQFKLNNALDKTYQSAENYNNQGRSVYVGLSYASF